MNGDFILGLMMGLFIGQVIFTFVGILWAMQVYEVGLFAKKVNK